MSQFLSKIRVLLKKSQATLEYLYCVFPQHTSAALSFEKSRYLWLHQCIEECSSLNMHMITTILGVQLCIAEEKRRMEPSDSANFLPINCSFLRKIKNNLPQTFQILLIKLQKIFAKNRKKNMHKFFWNSYFIPGFFGNVWRLIRRFCVAQQNAPS